MLLKEKNIEELLELQKEVQKIIKEKCSFKPTEEHNVKVSINKQDINTELLTVVFMAADNEAKRVALSSPKIPVLMNGSILDNNIKGFAEVVVKNDKKIKDAIKASKITSIFLIKEKDLLKLKISFNDDGEYKYPSQIQYACTFAKVLADVAGIEAHASSLLSCKY